MAGMVELSLVLWVFLLRVGVCGGLKEEADFGNKSKYKYKNF
jgi:hypothetical protein